MLIEAENPVAGDILALISECGSAKETIIAVQEALEQLAHRLTSEDDVDAGKVFLSLERIIHSYASCKR